MERRKFIRQSVCCVAGAGAAGRLLATGNMVPAGSMIIPQLVRGDVPFSPRGPGPARGTGSAPEPAWIIHENGSFDLVMGKQAIRECYPSFREHPIFPRHTETRKDENGGRIIYRLDAGTLVLDLSGDAAGLTLDCALEGMDIAPTQVYPLAGGRLAGFDRFYKQGFGFAGPSGMIEIGQPEELRFDPHPVSRDVWSYDSYLVTGCISPGEATLVMGAFGHRDFLQRCSIYNRHRRFGLTDRRTDTCEAYLEAGYSTEGIPTGGTGTLQLPTLHFRSGSHPYDTFRDFAISMAESNHVVLKKPRYHYCSWYEHGYRFNLDQLTDLLEGMQHIRPPVPLRTIQIDAGYCVLGDWLIPNERWPSGMEKAFRAIRKAGYGAGVWVGPFMVNTTSRIYRDHRDWLLRDSEGNIIVEWEQDTHGEGSVCILDSSHPEAFAYLRSVFRTLKNWGATYFKTDFMDWGFRDSTRVTRYAPGKTSAQYFNEVLEMIREEIGQESFWLGCICPFAPMVGYADAIRVSNDVSPGWSMGGTVNMFREMFRGQYFNNVLWQNDPDVFYLRDHDNNLNQDEMESLALWAGFTGGVVNTSDSIHRLSEARLRFLRFLEPPAKAVTADLHRWSEPGPEILVGSRKLLNGHLGLLVINLSETAGSVALDLEEITGPGRWYRYRWEPGKIYDREEVSMVRHDLGPHQSALFYLTPEAHSPDPGITISGEKKPGIASI